MLYSKYVRISPLDRGKEYLHCCNCNCCIDDIINVWDSCPNCQRTINESLVFEYQNAEDIDVRAEAAYRLGCFHLDRADNGALGIGDACMNVLTWAIFWFMRAASLNHLDAMYRLAKIYSESDTELDVATALAYIEKISARKDEVDRRRWPLLQTLKKECQEKIVEIRDKAGLLPIKFSD